MQSLVQTGSLKDFFRILLDEAVSQQHMDLAQGTQVYLANLLADFAEAEKLFPEEFEGKRGHEPLAVLYHRALQADRGERARMLRRLGDISLYKSGFFADALRESVVGADYYIQMGCAAYREVAALSRGSMFCGVYWELHEKFRALVEVLELISARGQANAGPEGELRLFERWVRSGSEPLAAVLADVGLIAPKGRPN